MSEKILVFLSLIVVFAIIYYLISNKNHVENKTKYTKEFVVIDDSLIGKGDPFEIIDPVWWTANIYESYSEYEKSLFNFSQEQRFIFAICWYMTEVNNGGHEQFFYNSTGIVWKDVLDAFNKIGADRNVAILKDAINLFTENPSFNRKERIRQMKNYDNEKSNIIDDKYYDSEIELHRHMIKYIKENSAEFYFRGEVKRPVYSL